MSATRFATIRSNLKKKYPNRKFGVLDELEAELAAIGDDYDSDIEERERQDAQDLIEYQKELVVETPALPKRQTSFRVAQDERIEDTHKKILAKAPTLFLPRKAKLEADVKDLTAAGRTPLHKAAVKGNLEEVQKLVESGADLSIKDNSGMTAGDLALEEEHMEVALFLSKAMTYR